MGMFRQTTIHPIDQDRRRALCAAILTGDAETADCARHDLAELYATAGYASLARALRQATDGGKAHARAVVGE